MGPAAGPTPGVMVGDGGMPVPGSAQTFNPTDPAASATSRKMPRKKLLIPIIIIIVVLLGIASWYFGYYMSSGVIYSQSLKNTGKGYDKLVTYVDQQQQLTDKQGYTGNGSYKMKFGDFSTDGKVALKADSDNSQLTFDVGLGVTRVNADIRTFKSSGDTPDIYVKAADIKGLGTVLGIPEIDANLAKLDNTWIVIDHTLIDNLSGIATAPAEANAAKMQGPTRDQLLDESRAFGKVNQQYLFSTSKNTAVTNVVKKYGIENVDGHKTYHYKVALQKDNVKKYIYAQRDALKASKLNDWLKQNKYDKDAYDAFNSAADSTKDIKSTDTYDIWMDVNHRVVYKVRFSDTASKNAADNYVDVGLDYKGGDSYPFFVSGNFKGDDGNANFIFVTTLNTKSGDTNFKLNVKTGGMDAGTATANFDFKPSTAAIKIAKPTGAIPLSQILSDFGYGDILSQYQGSQGGSVYEGTQDKAKDSKRKSDILTIQTQLEAFFQNNGYYPSLTDMNSGVWLAANMKSLDQSALSDPSSNGSQKLVAAPAAGAYAYQVTDAGGKSCEATDTTCAKYTLTATLAGTNNGQTTYSKSNLD